MAASDKQPTNEVYRSTVQAPTRRDTHEPPIRARDLPSRNPRVPRHPALTTRLQEINTSRHGRLSRDTPDVRAISAWTPDTTRQNSTNTNQVSIEMRAVNRQPWSGEHRRWTSLWTMGNRMHNWRDPPWWHTATASTSTKQVSTEVRAVNRQPCPGEHRLWTSLRTMDTRIHN